MAGKVIDSWAVLAFLEDAPGADDVEKLLVRAENSRTKQRLLLSAISWGEIYASVLEVSSKDAAEKVAKQISELPIELVAVGEDLGVVRQAAMYRGSKGLSYAGSFEAALAKLRNAELITGNPELRALNGELRVKWLGDPD